MENSIKEKIDGKKVTVIVLFKHWHYDAPAKLKKELQFRKMENWYVVGTYSDFHDGEKSNIENRVTLCITPFQPIANQVFVFLK